MKKTQPLFTPLRFETRLFGYKCVSIADTVRGGRLMDVLRQLKEQHVRLAYWIVHSRLSQHDSVAVASGGMLVDKKITYSIDHTKMCNVSTGSNIRLYRNVRVNKKLMSLALQSGKYSRFHLDTHFVHGEYEKLYTRWITKSVIHPRAYTILTYMSGKTIKGFISLEYKKNSVNIGLLAVEKRYRGKGIGKALVCESLRYCHNKGYNRVTVTTQWANKPACRLYESVGFSKDTIEHVYHFWL